MPGNNGTTLTIYGDFQRSDNCDKEFNRISQGFWRKEHLALADKVDHHQPPPDGRPVAADEFNPVEQTKKLQVHPKDPLKTVNVSKTLTDEQEAALIKFLREQWEIFAWEPSDMPGIPRELAEHALNVNHDAKPVQQAMRRYSEPRRVAMSLEVHRLLKAGFIREIKEATWVANPVMVPKKDTDILRMCIDFTDLNKHCPKDHFPLP